MMSSIIGSWILTAALLGGSLPPELSVTLYRSYYPPNLTLVNGLFRVDGAMLGTGEACEYRVHLAVEDSTGTRLVNNEWEGRCPPPQNGVAAGALETFQFAVVPATYTVSVTVEAKGTPSSRLTAKIPLESLPPGAFASDLILARKAGWIDSTRTDVQWTIRKGQLGIAAASEVVAEETNPSIAYYIELYPAADRPMNGSLTGVIRRPDGMQIAKLPLQSIQSVSEAKPVAGNLSLAGLAPGNYVLEARLDLGDTVIVRTHAFRMEGRTFAQPAASSNWFQSVSDERLAELFDAVAGTLQKQSDRELYERLNPDGRRRFLAQYFGVTGPSPEGSPKNALDHYLERAAHVNSTYTSRVGEPGWKTDRGRVYLLRGEPQAKVARPLPPGGAAPYEVWHFTSAPGYAYVFIDESRVGSYRLIWTSDPNEASLPDWDRRLSAEALEEMFRMGIRPPRTGGGSDRE